LDSPLPGNQGIKKTRYDLISNGQAPIFENLEKEDRNKKLKRILNTLDPRTRNIIEMRYGLNGQKVMDYRQTAKLLGVSYQRVEEIKKNALKRIGKFKSTQALKECMN
jgi:RNA polymerase sporulation-specific sigma factor